MIPEGLEQRWESAYRRYGETSTTVAVARSGDRGVAAEMAAASSDVAAMWRELESSVDLPWWMLAALSAAAQAFEFQARDWKARADDVSPLDDGRRPQVRLATRAQPTPYARRRAGGTS